jgi:hypothetical protein
MLLSDLLFNLSKPDGFSSVRFSIRSSHGIDYPDPDHEEHWEEHAGKQPLTEEISWYPSVGSKEKVRIFPPKRTILNCRIPFAV